MENSTTTALSIQDRAIAYISNIETAIASASTIEQARDLTSKTKALQAYASSSGESLDMLNNIAEMKIRAERKAGSILLQMEKKTNQHGEKNRSIPALEELGISRMQASRWQAVARVSEDDFVQYCKTQRESNQEITQSGVIRLKSRREDAPRDKPHFPCPSCGLRSNRCIETGEVLARVLPRRRKCLHCNSVFKTWEFVIDPSNPPDIPIYMTPGIITDAGDSDD